MYRISLADRVKNVPSYHATHFTWHIPGTFSKHLSTTWKRVVFNMSHLCLLTVKVGLEFLHRIGLSRNTGAAQLELLTEGGAPSLGQLDYCRTPCRLAYVVCSLYSIQQLYDVVIVVYSG